MPAMEPTSTPRNRSRERPEWFAENRDPNEDRSGGSYTANGVRHSKRNAERGSFEKQEAEHCAGGKKQVGAWLRQAMRKTQRGCECDFKNPSED